MGGEEEGMCFYLKDFAFTGQRNETSLFVHASTIAKPCLKREEEKNEVLPLNNDHFLVANFID